MISDSAFPGDRNALRQVQVIVNNGADLFILILGKIAIAVIAVIIPGINAVDEVAQLGCSGICRIIYFRQLITIGK